MRTDERSDIRDQVVYFLSGMGWLGYKYMSTDRKYLKEVLKPRVDKITNHIYNRGLCLATFFSTITEEEMWEIVN